MSGAFIYMFVTINDDIIGINVIQKFIYISISVIAGYLVAIISYLFILVIIQVIKLCLCTYKRQSKLNKKGLTIRYDIGKIFLKSEVFRTEGYYDALSTYVHEMCHMFGGDASASFSQALTFATELLLENHEGVTKGKIKWDQAFAAEKALNEM